MRKKLVFIALLCIVFSGTISAQYFRDPKFKFGFTGGMEISSGSYSSLENIYHDISSKVGMKLGIVGQFRLSSNVFLIPELSFAQRGFKQKWGMDKDNFSLYDISETLNYLQVPINLMYKVKVGGNSYFTPFAGLSFAYPLAGKFKYKEKRDSGYVHEPVTDIIFGSASDADHNRNIECGLNLGVGYEYADFFVKLQYNLGFTNIINTNYKDYKDGDYFKNRNIGISIGYYIFH
jgi:hypothetical protein